VKAAQNGNALQFASGSMQQDKQVVLVAVAQDGKALQFASGSLQQDKQVVLVAVAQDGNVLQFAPESLQDKQVVLEAVAQDGNALQFAIRVAAAGQASRACSSSTGQRRAAIASESLQQDAKVELVAVAQDGNALDYASGSLQQDKQVGIRVVAGQTGRACGSSTGQQHTAVCIRVDAARTAVCSHGP
jgi:hypothetical protein